MILLIDNYDSFTYNLVHLLGELGAQTQVHRNDVFATPQEALEMRPQAIVLSPGPCTPDHSGICLDLVREAPEDIPIFGVCLGHQVVGQAFGGKIIRAPEPVHGKLSRIHHNSTPFFKGLPSQFEATRYHSLMVEQATLPDCLRVTAHTEDGIIMALEHETLPIYGVQFHPESIACIQDGRQLLKNFLRTLPS